ncbi:DNA repair protein XRCC2 homolog isoform X2 [Magnolia sinica]|uniref:DNA repair protein XRCC2 homolog isoform X2 n=1 Tax=Magnolia sinica TaxID=86752 RepID=UPI00265A6062|nr:DNA repair protein XRCC2 homolog isoform X2 [Magnolia sinica]
MRYHLQKESEVHGVGAHFLMIDSINAFYWVDRASRPLPSAGDHRRNLSLQSVIETVVQEIRKLLQVQPMLVLATKANILGTGPLESSLKRTPLKGSQQGTSGLITSSSASENHFYRDFMPSVWQSFVTHRILLHASDENFQQRSLPIYFSQWVLPSLNFVDKFIAILKVLQHQAGMEVPEYVLPLTALLTELCYRREKEDLLAQFIITIALSIN